MRNLGDDENATSSFFSFSVSLVHVPSGGSLPFNSFAFGENKQFEGANSVLAAPVGGRGEEMGVNGNRGTIRAGDASSSSRLGASH